MPRRIGLPQPTTGSCTRHGLERTLPNPLAGHPANLDEVIELLAKLPRVRATHM